MVRVMKTKAIAVVGLAVILLAVGMASAQSTDPFNFRTPFAFVIGDTWVPAGAYTVRVMSPTGTLSFRGEDGNVSALTGSIPIEGKDASSHYKVIFHRYGDHYYISEIWAPGYRTGRILQPCTSETELAKEEQPKHVTVYADVAGE